MKGAAHKCAYCDGAIENPHITALGRTMRVHTNTNEHARAHTHSHTYPLLSALALTGQALLRARLHEGGGTPVRVLRRGH